MKIKNIKLTELVRMVFVEELKRSDKFLSTADVEMLLMTDGTNDPPRSSIVGYPPCPYYRELASTLERWMTEKVCPVYDLPSYPLLDEQLYIDQRAAKFKQVESLLDGLNTLWNDWNKEEKIHRLRTIFMLIERRGLLDLLGLRKTVGSKDYFPPSRKNLENTFRTKHSERAVLGVGARALAKHCHRDQTSSWWGISTGTEEDKNCHAEETMNKILDNATWINVHGLPQDIAVIEVRHFDGYGVRWTYEGNTFRGFLEPQMEGGHEVGWRH